jgi:hypothetical protein
MPAGSVHAAARLYSRYVTSVRTEICKRSQLRPSWLSWLPELPGQEEENTLDLLIILVILLLLFGGGGFYTRRPGYSGPAIGNILYILMVIVLIVIVLRLLRLF